MGLRVNKCSLLYFIKNLFSGKSIMFSFSRKLHMQELISSLFLLFFGLCSKKKQDEKHVLILQRTDNASKNTHHVHRSATSAETRTNFFSLQFIENNCQVPFRFYVHDEFMCLY